MLLSVVIFGLFHGLVFLPVLLSWLGPAPYFTDNYEPSIIDKGIAQLKQFSCEPSNKTKDKVAKFKQKTKDKWHNRRRQTLPDHKPFGKGNHGRYGDVIVYRGGVNRRGLLRGNRTDHGHQFAYTNPAFIPPRSVPYRDDSVIYLPMSDLLSLNFRLV